MEKRHTLCNRGKKHLLIASHKYPHLQTLSWILSSHCMGQTGSRVALSISVVRRKRSCNTWDPILFYHVNVLFNHCEFVDMKASKMSALSKPKICFSSVSLYDTSDDGSQVVAGKGSNAERLARATDILLQTNYYRQFDSITITNKSDNSLCCHRIYYDVIIIYYLLSYWQAALNNAEQVQKLQRWQLVLSEYSL